jgi:hypothetical protein
VAAGDLRERSEPPVDVAGLAVAAGALDVEVDRAAGHNADAPWRTQQAIFRGPKPARHVRHCAFATPNPGLLVNSHPDKSSVCPNYR